MPADAALAILGPVKALLPLALLLAPACAAPGPRPGAPTSDRATPALLEACQAACVHGAQARAVAPAVIEADCQQACAPVASWPWVDGGPAARRQLGVQVRLPAELAPGARAVTLPDGTEVALAADASLPEGPVVLAGRLDSTPEQALLLTVAYAVPR